MQLKMWFFTAILNMYIYIDRLKKGASNTYPLMEIYDKLYMCASISMYIKCTGKSTNNDTRHILQKVIFYITQYNRPQMQAQMQRH